MVLIHEQAPFSWRGILWAMTNALTIFTTVSHCNQHTVTKVDYEKMYALPNSQRARGMVGRPLSLML